MIILDQNWIQRSEATLNQIRKLTENMDKDRLELVRVMRFALGALGQSLGGWMQWINSPEIMSRFKQEELQDMAKTVTSIITDFIEYDIKMTNLGFEKGLAKRRSTSRDGLRFII